MVSVAIASDTSDSLPCQMNPLVSLDARGDLKSKNIHSFITLYAFEMFPH